MNIKEKLEKKSDYLKEYRKITQELYDDIHNASPYLDKREALEIKIAEINSGLKDDMKTDKTLEKVLSLSVERENLSEEFQEYFDISLVIKGNIDRIDEMDAVIRKEMQSALDELTLEIKKENTGNTAGYAKFAKVYGLQAESYSRTKTI